MMQMYQDGRLPLYHFDVYRMDDPWDMEETGYFDYLEGDGVCVIEWGDLIKEWLPPKVLRVTIDMDIEKGPGYRKIEIVDI